MIGKLAAIAIVGFAVLTMSCGTKDRAAQPQTTSDSSNAQPAIDQNASSQDSSDKPPTKMEVAFYAHLRPAHRDVLAAWLKSRPYLRPAVEAIDSGLFKSDPGFLRSTVGENGYQYYSTADMNQDGSEDFAVLLVDNRPRQDEYDYFSLAIFNAPLAAGQAPAYFEENLSDIAYCYIVFDRAVKRHLYLGKFESDVYCVTYYAKKKTYFYKDCMN